MSSPTPPTNTPTPHPNRLILIGALGGAAAVLLLVVAVLIGYWLGRTSQPSLPPNPQSGQQPTPARLTETPSAPASTGLLPPASSATATDAAADVTLTPRASLTPDPVLTTPIPTDPALAAEEIDRHTDEQQRLAAQKQTLSQQVTDSNQLIELKAEQIRLLEAELAKQP